jgi:quercetin dioxygenase-like cupin family protein
MARAGQSIHNPLSCERITFHRTAADTDGRLLEFELELAADGRVPAAPVHPEQEERSRVLEGTMKFRLGMRTIVAEAGEAVIVPAGRVHRFSNAGTERARARVEVLPALDMEDLLCTTAQLALDGHVTRSGMPSRCTWRCWYGASVARSVPPFPPAWMVQTAMAPPAALARVRGHAARYEPLPTLA